jgi:hypothetical protein
MGSNASTCLYDSAWECRLWAYTASKAMGELSPSDIWPSPSILERCDTHRFHKFTDFALLAKKWYYRHSPPNISQRQCPTQSSSLCKISTTMLVNANTTITRHSSTARRSITWYRVTKERREHTTTRGAPRDMTLVGRRQSSRNISSYADYAFQPSSTILRRKCTDLGSNAE